MEDNTVCAKGDPGSMRKKSENPKKCPEKPRSSAAAKVDKQEQGKAEVDYSVDIMADCEVGQVAVKDQDMAVSSGAGPLPAHSSVVEEPPRKLAKQTTPSRKSESAGNDPGSPDSPPENRVKYKANYMRGMLVQERLKHKLWEESVAKEYGFDPVPWPGMAGESVQKSDDKGENSDESKGEKSKEATNEDKKKEKENESGQINRSSTTVYPGLYRQYKVGDVVMDLKTNAKCTVVIAQDKSRALPTLSFPLRSGVENCCHFDVLEFTTPAFPRNLPPLTSIKHVVCFDVLTPNAKDHTQQWRFMDQAHHRRCITWLRSDKRMTREHRTTVVALKDYAGKLLCKFATFCRVEEGS